MNLPRRRFLSLTVGAGLTAVPQIAGAQTYPTRPVHWVVGFPPGGTTDITARLIGQWLSERLGQPFVIENRPGAATNLATEEVVRAPADGYTILQVTTSNAINATLYGKLNYNFIHEITMVAGLVSSPLVHGGTSGASGPHRPRVHCLCQSQSRQAQLGVIRHRHDFPFG